MKDIVILGAGGMAREVAWLIECINENEPQWNLLGFIDEDTENHGEAFNGIRVLGDFHWFDTLKKEIHVVCAVGNPVTRKMLIEKCSKYCVVFATLVHPTSAMSKFNKIGEGTVVCANTTITTNTQIGNHAIINFSSTIGHDAVIGDYVTIAPGAHVSGFAKINKFVDVGAGAVIIQGIEIGEHSVIGAGSVVVKDIQPYCTALGIPAKPIKFNNINHDN